MKNILIWVILLIFASPCYADYAKISEVTLGSPEGYINTPVTISATAQGSNLYYKFWANTVDFCLGQPANWIVLRDWEATNAFQWTPQAAGFYTIVVWVSSDQGASCCNLAGKGFTVNIGEPPPECPPRIIPGKSLDGVKINGTFAEMKTSWGEPQTIGFYDFGLTFFTYFDEKIKGYIRDRNDNGTPDMDEEVIQIGVYSGYDGKTRACVGFGSTRNQVHSELGTSDRTGTTPGGFAYDYYKIGIPYVYDFGNMVHYFILTEPEL